ncbi:MAG: hypothetical protein HY203_04610 [Nitrospirae bacterium]|nr:hypothetical protein [Nitrospirota bacterium]
MDRLIDILSEIRRLKQWDRKKVNKEIKELSTFVVRQVFKQIPGVSAISALVIGAGVASTFTTSPWRATLARWGVIKGAKHVVSGPIYQFLSVVLPILVAAGTAYLVHKILNRVRERQMERDILTIARLGENIQAVVNEKLALLEKVKEAGLISGSEYHTKKASLYATYARIHPTDMKALVFDKLRD